MYIQNNDLLRQMLWQMYYTEQFRFLVKMAIADPQYINGNDETSGILKMALFDRRVLKTIVWIMMVWDGKVTKGVVHPKFNRQTWEERGFLPVKLILAALVL